MACIRMGWLKEETEEALTLVSCQCALLTAIAHHHQRSGHTLPKSCTGSHLVARIAF